MVELLKQNQFSPMPVAEQVVMIYAGTKGHLDSVPINDVAQWEADFLEFIRDQKSEILSGITESGDISDDLEQQLLGSIDEFNRLQDGIEAAEEASDEAAEADEAPVEEAVNEASDTSGADADDGADEGTDDDVVADADDDESNAEESDDE